ncbi:MAG: bifunctional phosphopantothenoylcysteine decarboxylase/phosphopantothenate--cysteine ligase CoaBC [Porticoccaceae bacterium]|nr:bifunctional phosphopantothenoylcysteine decarboxylase/phosphopantothenate--cysteine ligase CoaBC [Porticoccaceae bacterium]|tara:strand:+ start:859 stop:2064 length:1206 start_codon:yes stop_codon:yes gene_type:complete
MLSNKRILVGITGGIAAYKSAEIVRLLRHEGADVQVVMTKAAKEFIPPITLQALSGNPVHSELINVDAESGMGHIELARWADLLLIAPATANFISDMNCGKADSLLGSVHLATTADIMIAPAMNQAMWKTAANQANIRQLERRGVKLIGPEEGPQACGDFGMGRMAQSTTIVKSVIKQFKVQTLDSKKVVITAGPTREPIDPVRYISNRSSGKMGYAMAEAAIDAGAQVTLISGPVTISPPERCFIVNVETALEMYEESLTACKEADVFIGTAAVADFRCESISRKKIKRTADAITLNFIKNIDILTEVRRTNENLYLVGFAAETEDMEVNGYQKLRNKSLNAIVTNDVSRMDIGFDSDENEVCWMTEESVTHINKKLKEQLARDLIAKIANEINTTSSLE